MEKEWKYIAEESGKKAEHYFFMYEISRVNNQPTKQNYYLNKQLEELQKQYEYMKKVGSNILSNHNQII